MTPLHFSDWLCMVLPPQISLLHPIPLSPSLPPLPRIPHCRFRPGANCGYPLREEVHRQLFGVAAGWILWGHGFHFQY